VRPAVVAGATVVLELTIIVAIALFFGRGRDPDAGRHVHRGRVRRGRSAGYLSIFAGTTPTRWPRRRHAALLGAAAPEPPRGADQVVYGDAVSPARWRSRRGYAAAYTALPWR
jgi:hypothetical protein